LISNFRRVLNVVCFRLGDSPASEFYMPTFRNTSIFIGMSMKMEQCSETSTYCIKFRCRGITQKKAYNNP